MFRLRPQTRIPASEILLRSFRVTAPAPRLRPLSTTGARFAIDPPPGAGVKTAPVVSPDEAKASRARARTKALVNKLPERFRPFADRLLSAPGSYIFTFMLIHEMTAVVPLFGLVWLFDYLDFMPSIPQSLIDTGLEFYKKAVPESKIPVAAEAASKFLLHGAAAYAIVKMLLPVRLLFSLAVTPWFARWSVIPLTKRVSALFKRKPPASRLDVTTPKK